LISRETLLFEEFLELLERQKTALVANDVATLNDVTARQREALHRSHELNRQREALIEDIKRDKAVEGDLTVAQLLEFTDESQAEMLLKLKHLILELNDKIHETRNSNALLLNQSREVISHTLAALASMNAPSGNYVGAGKSQPSQTATLAVDRRV
jgi:hypothetical protein